MPRFRFVDDEVTTNEMPKEEQAAVAEKPKSKAFRFVDEKRPSGIAANAKEFVQQAPVGFAQQAIGSYGDILDLLGLQARGQLPGAQAFQEAEAKASPIELAAMSEADDVLPRYSRLPSSEEAGKGVQALTGVGEPKTAGGRYGKSIGRAIGGSTAFGQPMVATGAAAGTLGQSAEELGLPGWVRAAVEIGTYLRGSKAKSPVSSSTPGVKQEINRLRELGFNEEDITLAKSALEDRGFLKKVSKMTGDARQQFNSTVSNLTEKANTLVSDAFPGLEKGIDSLQEQASKLYNMMDQFAGSVTIPKGKAFQNAANEVVTTLKKTLANTPDENQMIKLFESASEAAGQPTSADYYTRFYRAMNRLGQWVDPSERERIFTTMKDSIRQTFRESGPEGKALAETFDAANKGWRRFRQAEDVVNLMGKSITDEGINFKKLAKSLDNPKNYDTLVEGIGEKSAQNLKAISRTGSEIKDLEKVMTGEGVKQALGAGKLYAITKGLVTMDVGLLKTFIAAESMGRVATKWLTEPKYQNIHRQMLEAIKDQKWNILRTLAQKAEKDFERQNMLTKQNRSQKAK